jgi:hypothetical protein
MNSPQRRHEVRLRGLHPQDRRRAAVWVAAMLIASPLGAQPRPATTAAVQPFVAVDAPVVALTHARLVDLVVIRGDPVATPSQVYEVTLVFRDGLGYDSARLREFAQGKVGIF